MITALEAPESIVLASWQLAIPHPHHHVSTALAYLGWRVRIPGNSVLECNRMAFAEMMLVEGTAPPLNPKA